MYLKLGTDCNFIAVTWTELVMMGLKKKKKT